MLIDSVFPDSPKFGAPVFPCSTSAKAPLHSCESTVTSCFLWNSGSCQGSVFSTHARTLKNSRSLMKNQGYVQCPASLSCCDGLLETCSASLLCQSSSLVAMNIRWKFYISILTTLLVARRGRNSSTLADSICRTLHLSVKSRLANVAGRLLST